MKQEFNANEKVANMLNDDERVNIYNQGFKKGQEHIQSAPETRERLAKLETNQTNLMEQNSKEHAEIKEAIIDLKKTVKEATDNKAEKKDVEDLKKDVEDLKSWKWKLIGIGIILIFLVTFFKDVIINIFTK